MTAYVEALKSNDEVLEVGFCPITHIIQKKKPKKLTIAEGRQHMILEARTMADENKNIELIEGDWSQGLKDLKSYSIIFFHPFVPTSQTAEVTKGRAELREEANKLNLEKMKYEESVINEFINGLDGAHKPDPQHLLTFLHDMEKNGQISNDLLQKTIAKLEKKGFLTRMSIENFSINEEKIVQFVENCLGKHLAAKGKIVLTFKHISSNLQKHLQKIKGAHVKIEPGVQEDKEPIFNVLIEKK